MTAGGTTRPLRVAVDARVPDGRWGGVQQWVIGVASSLTALEDGDEDYAFLGRRDDQDWLPQYLHGRGRLVDPFASKKVPMVGTAGRRLGRAVAYRLPALRRAVVRRREAWTARPVLPRSPGVLERSGVEVVHFTFQAAFVTDVPSIYQPWDLQHLHLPEFFSPAERRRRDLHYRTFAERAATVIVATPWAKRDVHERLGIPLERLAVVPVPPPTNAYAEPTPADVERVERGLGLSGAFVLYPAQTWRHKNHLRLLEALAILRDHTGSAIPLVCTGATNDHYTEVKAAVRRLGLADSVRFLGFVNPRTIRVLYGKARMLAFPSLFEGWGIPIVEAFSAGLPVACSNTTSLPDLVGDAAVVFDPYDPEAMADAIGRVWGDAALRAELVVRGRRVVARLDWAETAHLLRAHYRRIAGRPLDAADAARVATSLGQDSR